MIGFFFGFLATATLVLLGVFAHPAFLLPVLLLCLVHVYAVRDVMRALPKTQVEYAIAPASMVLAVFWTPWALVPWAVLASLAFVGVLWSVAHAR